MVVVVVDGEVGEVGEEEVMSSTRKMPPRLGCRATSERALEKVERSSWAYCVGC